MVKSLFGLVNENNRLHTFTRCCRINANEGKASDTLLFTTSFSVYSYLFTKTSPSTQQPCSLTDSSSPKSGRLLNTSAKCTGFNSGNFIVRGSGLSFSTLISERVTMPPREKKTAGRLFYYHSGRFSSSRYSLASIGLKGDQNLICE